MRLGLNLQDYNQGIIKETPFDLCCPSIQSMIAQRSCKNCGLYHSSIKSLKKHFKICRVQKPYLHPTLDDTNPIKENRRPVRIAAQRQKEKMVIWKSRLDDEHVDWFDDDDEIQCEQNIDHQPQEQTIPVFDIAEHMNNIWEEY
jgi:hypothetical protein